MPLPWLRILDAVIGVTDLARSRKIRSAAASEEAAADTPARLPTGIETRLAGVVVAALKEAFDRDTRRLELEREQLEGERRRAERALQLEVLRQAADREIGRLRAMAATAIVTLLGSMFVAIRAAATAPKVTIGIGWLFLLGAILASFNGQSSVSDSVARERTPTTDAGVVALWLTVVGLALVALSVLL
ncbi:MAG TPA: hypothetical protein VFA27_11040 [Vicinamibacterales bacterium]|nr:hypothetical protein [Vicinamibacterales bacterium]